MRKIVVSLCLLFVAINLHSQGVREKMDELLTAYEKQNKFNGTVLVAKKGNVLFEKAYGYRNAEQKIMHDRNSIFQIGSLTKQFTAAIIMQLAEENKLSLQDKLSKYFPGFANGDKITIEHLLTHTSGLFNYTSDTAILKSNVTKHYSQQEFIDIIRKYNPDFEPGSKMSYSNSGYQMLGYIIEKVTNKPYEQVVRERILYPLKMVNTGFDFTHLDNLYKSKGYFSLQGEKGLPAPVVDSTIAYAAGALYSTMGDLYLWERAIYTDKVLKQNAWKSVFTPYMSKYGYGWGIDRLYGKLINAHSGGIHGFTSYLLRFPEDELAIIVLSNSSSPVLSQISRSLAAIVYNKAYTIPQERKAITLNSSVLQQYVGEYQLMPTFSITITAEGTQLKAQATGQSQLDFFPEKEDFFFATAVDAQLEFLKDESGKVNKVILHQGGRKQEAKKIK